jgi:hypothetical protein
MKTILTLITVLSTMFAYSQSDSTTTYVCSNINIKRLACVEYGQKSSEQEVYVTIKQDFAYAQWGETELVKFFITSRDVSNESTIISDINEMGTTSNMILLMDEAGSMIGITQGVGQCEDWKSEFDYFLHGCIAQSK